MNDDAVSDVIGNILLVGITVALMSGMSLAVLAIGGPADTLHADLAVDVRRGGTAWGDGDEQVRLRHVGGEPVPAGVKVTVSIDGVRATHTPSDGGFADGVLRMGESWSLTTTIAEGAPVSVVVIDPGSNSLVISTGLLGTTGASSGGGVGVGTGTTVYVDTGAATVGTLADLDAAKAAGDGASATLTEASSPGTTPTTETRSATTVTASSGATDRANVLASDDARALFSGLGDSVEVEGFSIPADADVTTVVVGFEAQRSGTGPPNSPQLTLSYTLGGAPGPTTLPAAVADASDTSYTLDITGDRPSWTPADVAALHLVLTRDSLDAGFRDADVDHLFVQVTYTLPVTDLVATFDFTGIPDGTHTLQLRYTASGDSFDLQVRDLVAGTWSSRGTLSSTTAATFTYVLLPDEHEAGVVQLRFEDGSPNSGTGVLSIDYARVVAT